MTRRHRNKIVSSLLHIRTGIFPIIPANNCGILGRDGGVVICIHWQLCARRGPERGAGGLRSGPRCIIENVRVSGGTWRRPLTGRQVRALFCHSFVSDGRGDALNSDGQPASSPFCGCGPNAQRGSARSIPVRNSNAGIWATKAQVAAGRHYSSIRVSIRYAAFTRDDTAPLNALVKHD